MPPPSKPGHHEPGVKQAEIDELAGLRREKAETQRQLQEAQERAAILERQVQVAGQNAVMAAEVQHPDVQRLFRSGYESYVEDTRATGKGPVPFDEWFRHDHVRQSPVYAPHFRAPASPQQAPGVLPPAKPPARVENGERSGAPAGPSTLTDAQIQAWCADPKLYRENRDKIIAHNTAKYGHNPLGGKLGRGRIG
jgi:hypothetical protein